MLQVGVHKDHAGAGVTQDVVDVLGGQAGVHRHQDRAHRRHREVGFEQLGCVGTQERHPVARLDAGVPQRRRQPIGAFAELAIAVAPLSVDHRGALPEHRRGARQERHRGEHFPVHGAVAHIGVVLAHAQARVSQSLRYPVSP